MWLASRRRLRGLGVLPSRCLGCPAKWASSSHVAEAAAAGAAAHAARAVRSAAYAGGVAKALPLRSEGELLPLKWELATTSGMPDLHMLQEQHRQAPSFRLILRNGALHAPAWATFSLLGQTDSPTGAPQASTLGGPQASTPRASFASTRAARRQLGSACCLGTLPTRLGPLYRSINRSFSSTRLKRVDAPRYWEASMKPSFPSSNQRSSKQQPLEREQQWQQQWQQPDFDRVAAGGSRIRMPTWSWMLLLGVSGTAVVCWLSERRRRIEAEAAAAAAQAAAAAAAERSALGWFWPDWASLGGSLGGGSDTSSRRLELSSPSQFPGHVWWAWETPRSPKAFDLIAFSSDFLPLQAHEPPWGSRQRHRQTTDANPWRSSAAAAEMLLGLNALIFVAWRVAAIASKSAGGGRLLQLLMHHFLASREAMRAKRFHTLLTASLSHAAFPHILMNWMLLQLLLQQLQPMLSGPEVWALWALSSLMGVVAHMSVSSLPVLGASSFACCLLWVEGVCRSRDLFMTVLPVPGWSVAPAAALTTSFVLLQHRQAVSCLGSFSREDDPPKICVMLTALQLSQLNLLVNGGLYMLSRFGKGRVARALQGVSWVGHLGGIAAGCLFAAYKRHITHDKNWGSFTNLSRTFSATDWWAGVLPLLPLLMLLSLLPPLLWQLLRRLMALCCSADFNAAINAVASAFFQAEHEGRFIGDFGATHSVACKHNRLAPSLKRSPVTRETAAAVTAGTLPAASARRLPLMLGEKADLPVLQMKLDQLRRRRQLRRAFET
ncbi:hypothetical protein Emag_000669 [Eimeria magna]